MLVESLKRCEAAHHWSIALEGDYHVVGTDENDAGAKILGKKVKQIQSSALFAVRARQKMRIYKVVNDRDGGSGFEVTRVKGEHFPPTKTASALIMS